MWPARTILQREEGTAW